MSALAAARRGSSALGRVESRTLPATAMVLPNQPGFDWDKIRALPEVEALSTFVVDYALAFDGIGGADVGFPFADDAFGRTLEKPVILSGRMFDSTREDEAVVTRGFVQNQHVGVGDTVTLNLPSAAQLKSLESSAADEAPHYDGPHITVHIVGVALSPWLSDSAGSSGGIQMSPAVVANHPAETIGDPKDPDNTDSSTPSCDCAAAKAT